MIGYPQGDYIRCPIDVSTGLEIKDDCINDLTGIHLWI